MAMNKLIALNENEPIYADRFLNKIEQDPRYQFIVNLLKNDTDITKNKVAHYLDTTSCFINLLSTLVEYSDIASTERAMPYVLATLLHGAKNPNDIIQREFEGLELKLKISIKSIVQNYQDNRQWIDSVMSNLKDHPEVAFAVLEGSLFNKYENMEEFMLYVADAMSIIRHDPDRLKEKNHLLYFSTLAKMVQGFSLGENDVLTMYAKELLVFVSRLVDKHQYSAFMRYVKSVFGAEYTNSQEFLTAWMNDISEKVKTLNIKFEFNGRVKDVYSYLKKLKVNLIPVNNPTDLFAVRFVVEDEVSLGKLINYLLKEFGVDKESTITKPDGSTKKAFCFYGGPKNNNLNTLLEKYLEQGLIDETSNKETTNVIRKDNGYVDFHLLVPFGENGGMIEIQVRTKKQHEYNEHGLGSHKVYKNEKNYIEGKSRVQSFNEKHLEYKGKAVVGLNGMPVLLDCESLQGVNFIKLAALFHELYSRNTHLGTPKEIENKQIDDLKELKMVETLPEGANLDILFNKYSIEGVPKYCDFSGFLERYPHKYTLKPFEGASVTIPKEISLSQFMVLPDPKTGKVNKFTEFQRKFPRFRLNIIDRKLRIIGSNRIKDIEWNALMVVFGYSNKIDQDAFGFDHGERLAELGPREYFFETLNSAFTIRCWERLSLRAE